MFALVAGQSWDAFVGQEVAHRRIDILVGARNVQAPPLQHRRQRRHGGAADANQMNLHETAPSSMMIRGRASATTRHLTPNGSVIDAPAVCPDGNPNRT